MKTSKNYLDEANAKVSRIDAKSGIEKHARGGSIFVDVRDSAAIAESGTIKGALLVPRGFIEFAADDATPFHNAELKKDAEIYLVCGKGGQAALAGKTLIEMGFTNVTNIGGISEWIDAGGPIQKA
ncbi:MAG: rhodanese-like domain-containing protein [Rhizobiales bacterium]|nr:rhodanese-like domain-containing protein [Hyphomicrobiales bacterium]